ncbi:acyl-CoA thioesterase [Ancylobacter terrae]|uniref:acyl-CoA thioesterase n=1 Tax=Ancylobacter sp. sgz301288 TaxID=3342077 RepID=UPI00385DE166
MSGAAAAVTTRLIDIVFPGATNHHGTLFGGAGLALMDRVAFIAAAGHSRRAVVMAAAPAVAFAREIRPGAIIEVEARRARAGRSSMTVETRLWSENLGTGERYRCGTGTFVMVAVDADHRPVPVHV